MRLKKKDNHPRHEQAEGDGCEIIKRKTERVEKHRRSAGGTCNLTAKHCDKKAEATKKRGKTEEKIGEEKKSGIKSRTVAGAAVDHRANCMRANAARAIKYVENPKNPETAG